MAKWNKSETLLLLTLYEQHPFLYKSSDPNYTNMGLRRMTLDDICAELKKSKPEVTVDEIKLKMKTLRSQLLKEKRLIEYSKKNNEEYVPMLWSYRHMTFLNDSLDCEHSDAVNTSDPIGKPEFVPCEVLENDCKSEQSIRITTNTPAKRKHADDADDFRQKAAEAFDFAKSYAEQVLQTRLKQEPETKESIFAKYLCTQLKLIQSEQNYEDTTWKILQIVREGIRKEGRRRQDYDSLEIDYAFNEPIATSSTNGEVQKRRKRSIYDRIL